MAIHQPTYLGGDGHWSTHLLWKGWPQICLSIWDQIENYLPNDWEGMTIHLPIYVGGI